MSLSLTLKMSGEGDYDNMNNKEESENIISDYSIHLEGTEERLFSLLVNAADWWSKKEEQEVIEVRVAGGWVRDRILGLHSYDVDIAVDRMYGLEFATVITNYLEYLSSNGKNPEVCHTPKVSVIAANPQQSKHLETATMKLLGIEMDFVNLRAEETYSSDSRIPLIKKKFGTPLEDAKRRDLTINALFFNLRTKKVEDFTGHGLSHLLVQKLIQTPMDPFMTFSDDPLRVLRAIRFAVRYDFNIASDLKQAALSPEVHESLLKKVSRERVGKELDGMLIGKGAKPHKACSLLVDLGLARPVFSLPDVVLFGSFMGNSFHGVPNQINDNLFKRAWDYSKLLVEAIPDMLKVISKSLTEDLNNLLDVRLLYLSTFLYVFFDVFYEDSKQKHSRVVVWMLKEGVKFKNKDILIISLLMDNLKEVRDLLLFFNSCEEFPSPPSRLKLGLIVRKLKESWLLALLLSTIVEIHAPLIGNTSLEKSSSSFQQHQFQLLNTCLFFSRSIFKLELQTCWKMQPVLNGKELIDFLNIPRGPNIGEYLNEQIKWMLQNPLLSKEECKEFFAGVERET